MLKIALIFVLVCASGQASTEDKKLSIIQRKALSAAAAIRRIQLVSSKDTIQLTSMASEFILELNVAAYFVNTGVPNIPNEKEHKGLASTAQSISGYSNNLQRYLFDEPLMLREKLADTLEDISEASSKFQSPESDNRYLASQLDRKHDQLIFAIYKLRSQALLFDKPNKILDNELVISTNSLRESIDYLSNGKDAEEDVRNVLRHLSLLTAKNVYKLDSWVAANQDKPNETRAVRETSKILSTLYDRVNRLGNSKENVQYLKNQLLNVIETGLKQVARLTRISYPDNTGGEECIRSALFDGIALGKSYAAIIKSASAQ